MAAVSRLIQLCLCTLLVLSSFPALAAYEYSVNWGAGTTSGHSTAQSACSAAGSARIDYANSQDGGQRLPISSIVSGTVPSLNCQVKWSCVNDGVRFECATVNMPIVRTGTDDDDQACSSFATVQQSTLGGSYDISVPGNVGSGEVCLDIGLPSGKGCKVNFQRDISYAKDGAWVSQGTYSFAGGSSSSCSIGGGTATPPAEPNTCKGGYSGQVNGVDVCIKYPADTPTTSDDKKTTTTTSPTGTETKEDTKTTVCQAGACTTTTTTTVTNSSGTSTTTTATTQPKGEYCAANTGAEECSGDGAFGGSCDAGFVASGDALLSATAKAVNETKCLLDPGSATDSVASALTAGTFGPELQTTNRSLAQFNQTNPLGGSCPADTTVNAGGVAFTIPLSQACGALQALGAIAVLFTLIYSSIFVIKGF